MRTEVISGHLDSYQGPAVFYRLSALLIGDRISVARSDVSSSPEERGWHLHVERPSSWSGDGTWVLVLDELRRDADQAEGAQWTVGIDAGIVRAHQHAAGARHQPPADVPEEVVAPVELDTGGGVE